MSLENKTFVCPHCGGILTIVQTEKNPIVICQNNPILCDYSSLDIAPLLRDAGNQLYSYFETYGIKIYEWHNKCWNYQCRQNVLVKTYLLNLQLQAELNQSLNFLAKKTSSTLFLNSIYYTSEIPSNMVRELAIFLQ
jgi:ssDNA-binding Zn-finger/Zn-ribbon topoisomerase 1